MECIIQELEAAAAIIMGPPNQISYIQRQSAEAIFLNFRKTKNPYALCRQILETSAVEYVLFEAAGLLKIAISSEWNYLQLEDKTSLREYLINYLMSNTCSWTIREKVTHVVAIMIKRMSLEDFGVERTSIFNELKSRIMNQDINQKIICSSILLSTAQEYNATIKSDSGMTFSDHFKVKYQFERSELNSLFILVIKLVDQFINEYQPQFNEHVTLMRIYLNILELILIWGYVPPKYPKTVVMAYETLYKSEDYPPLRLSVNWSAVIINETVIKSFFGLYYKVQTQPDLQQKCLACLIQLSSLDGPIVEDPKIKLKYLEMYLMQLLEFMQVINKEFDQMTARNEIIRKEDLLGLSYIFRRLMSYNTPKILKDLPMEILQSFFQQLFSLTMRCADETIRVEVLIPDETTYRDSYKNTLEAWVEIIKDKEQFSNDIFKPYFCQLFDKYLQCHIAPPEGQRNSELYNAHEELDEIEEKDQEKYKEELFIIGMIGREIVEHSLPILAKLLEDRIRRLYGQLRRMCGNEIQQKIINDKMLEIFFEDIHWLLIISGYLLSCDNEGEQKLIPTGVMNYSSQSFDSGVFDINTSLRVLGSPSQCITEIPNAENVSDPVIRIISAVFRLCEIEKAAIESKIAHLLSPELSSSIMWFLEKWAEPFLLPLPEYYGHKICQTFQEAFGLNTAGGNWTINFILKKICINVQIFTAEETVLADSIKLFMILVKKKHRCAAVYNSESFRSIVALKDMNLPSKSKSGLISGLVSTAFCIMEQNTRNQYIDGIIQPILDKYKSIIMQQNLNLVYQNEDVKYKIISVLEEIEATIEGIHLETAEYIAESLKFIFVDFHKLFELYHNYKVIVELILGILIKVCNSPAFLEQPRTSMVNSSCKEILKIYIKHNANRITSDSSAEEDSLQDLILLMNLMIGLLSKGYFDGTDDENNIEETAEIVIMGLTYLIPMITADLLKYPDFCLQYYKTLIFFIETRSQKLITLETELLNKILFSIELGLVQFGCDVQSICLDFLQIVSNTIKTDQNPTSHIYGAFQPFLKLLLELILSQQIVDDNKIGCGRALFALICTYREQYIPIVQHIIQSQNDAQKSDRLTGVFTELTTHIDLTNSRSMQMKFLVKFEKFNSDICFMCS